MAYIINGSINLSKIDKTKIISGVKGKYLPITITINDKKDEFENDGPITIQQSKEERESKTEKVYLGNIRVVWKSENNEQQNTQKVDDDYPF
jgi:hypothetical protein